MLHDSCLFLGFIVKALSEIRGTVAGEDLNKKQPFKSNY